MKLDRRKLGRRRWCELNDGDWVWVFHTPRHSTIGQVHSVIGYSYYETYVVLEHGEHYAQEYLRIKLAKATEEEVTAFLLST